MFPDRFVYMKVEYINFVKSKHIEPNNSLSGRTRFVATYNKTLCYKFYLYQNTSKNDSSKQQNPPNQYCMPNLFML